MSPLFGVFAGAAAIALVLTPVVRMAASHLGALDHPGTRRTHATSTPRLGGIAIAVAWAGTLTAVASFGSDAIRAPLTALPLAPILIGSVAIFAVGLIDDLRPLPASVKVLTEALAVAALVGAGLVISRVTVFGVHLELRWLSIVVTMVWMLGITNAFNLVDGLDGLAAGLAIIAGATCAAIVLIRGEQGTAVVLVALVGALVGFLPFNFNPASIFLGDCGSLLIGFVLALTAITGFQKGATALAAGVPILIFALPILDMGSTVVRRLLRGPRPRRWDPRAAIARIVRPDREHIHHRLQRRFSHRAAVLVLYAIALCLAAVALLTIVRP